MENFVFAKVHNFYVSCELIFNPGLAGVPVIVLDAENAVTAHSPEAQRLGIKIGDPYFKIEPFCRKMRFTVFPTNESLYANVCQRVMNLLSSAAEETEIVSMDEAFLKYSYQIPCDTIVSICQEVNLKIKKWVGIPVSMGIAPTKTLARIASDMVYKKNSNQILDLSSPSQRQSALDQLSVDQVPGLTPFMKQQLSTMEIRTAWEFSQMEPKLIRRLMGPAGEKLVWELKGIHQMSADQPLSHPTISYSRSFGESADSRHALVDTLTAFANGASAKLKEKKCGTKSLYVYLESVLDEQQGSSSNFSVTSSFLLPTNNAEEMTGAAEECFRKLYLPSERYKKCGFIANEICPTEYQYSCGPTDDKKATASAAQLNSILNKNTLSYSPMGTSRFRTQQTDIPFQHEWKGLAFAHAK